MISETLKPQWHETMTGYSAGQGVTTFRNREYQRVGQRRAGVKNPLFKSQIELGKEAGTSYALMVYGDIQSQPLRLSYKRGYSDIPNQFSVFNYEIEGWNRINFEPRLASEVKELLANESICKAKVFKDLKKDGHGLNAFISMLESKKTLRMLRNPADSIRKLLDSFMKKRRLADESYQDGMSQIRKSVKARKQLKAATTKLKDQRKRVIAESWLEVQFGVVPLISDVKEIVENYVDTVGAKGVKVRKHKKKHQTYVQRPGVIRKAYGSNDPSITGLINEQILVGLKSTIYYGFKTVPESQGLSAAQNLLRTSGLDFSLEGRQIAIENAIPALWEATRWSFLVDYVTNLGDILDAACTFTDHVFYTNYGREYEYNVSSTIWYTLVPAYPSYRISDVRASAPGFSNQKVVDYERVIAPLTIPSVVFSLPGSNKRYFNIAALLSLNFNTNSKGLRL